MKAAVLDKPFSIDVGLPITNDISIDDYANTYLAAIQALSISIIDMEQIITHEFALQDIKESSKNAEGYKY